MDAWYFTEMPYPHLPPQDSYASDRVSLSNGVFDFEIGADLYNRYLDEYVIADDLGLNLMLNEHHQTPTCLDPAVPLTAAILARETAKGRILVLGNPVANRADPVRIAEEMAMISIGVVTYGLPPELVSQNVADHVQHTRTFAVSVAVKHVGRMVIHIGHYGAPVLG